MVCINHSSTVTGGAAARARSLPNDPTDRIVPTKANTAAKPRKQQTALLRLDLLRSSIICYPPSSLRTSFWSDRFDKNRFLPGPTGGAKCSIEILWQEIELGRIPILAQWRGCSMKFCGQLYEVTRFMPFAQRYLADNFRPNQECVRPVGEAQVGLYRCDGADFRLLAETNTDRTGRYELDLSVSRATSVFLDVSDSCTGT